VIANQSSASESESQSPCVSLANNDPSSASIRHRQQFRKSDQMKNDARPVGGCRPRYAASGEITCAGDGEGGSEPVDEAKETSGEVVEGEGRWSVYDCARPRGSDALPAPATPPTPLPPAEEEVEKASWRCGVV
jgi:hypothetical protein